MIEETHATNTHTFFISWLNLCMRNRMHNKAPSTLRPALNRYFPIQEPLYSQERGYEVI